MPCCPSFQTDLWSCRMMPEACLQAFHASALATCFVESRFHFRNSFRDSDGHNSSTGLLHNWNKTRRRKKHFATRLLKKRVSEDFLR
ncbi:hypothetical protein TNCT_145611 [Trichonephila clavata]|uniref:Uncharacterized protein n=1 Tax=Trichonephila clavata TaxID=2740835 RepID=A0A8X6LHW5_TRICU|nr:hypothetical protein TNCT_145611 [Trichonephila clavata]